MAKNLVGLYYTQIVKSLKYLEFSFQRTLPMPLSPSEMSESQLEAWDSFSVRFSRTADIFLSKYIRAYILSDDPTFDGGFRDQLLRAEKLGLIQDVSLWYEIRELRNVIVHEYSDSDLEKIFKKFRDYTPILLELKSRLTSASL